MGRGKKRNFRSKGRNGTGNTDSWAGHPARADYVEVVKSNPQYEAFYSNTGLIPEDQLQEFWTALRRELPASFRFTGSKGHALVVQQRLVNHYIPQIAAVKFNGELVQPPTQLPWYPEKLAWSMTTPKNIIRRFAPFASFQKFLVSETSVGNISRQEVVSMIPPLLMDIESGMTVLDMCAAPGSKSAQLIEMVHGGEEARIRKVAQDMANRQQKQSSPDGLQVQLEQKTNPETGDWSDDGRSTGLLIANDNNYQRAQMLIHQVKRLNSPNLIVTNHDASIFPSIKISNHGGKAKYLKFDRILADVPCTGDGTARKNPNVWKDWMPSTGMGLHSLQIRILIRALQMLKVGGRTVYSTCSLNPVENEAVVAAAIEAVGGPSHVRIVDCHDRLPDLKRIPGVNSWKLMDRYQRFYETWEDLAAAKDDPTTENAEVLDKFTQTMFAPQSNSTEPSLALQHCMRVYPHLQDTGGFFIAVLEKSAEIKAATRNFTDARSNGKHSAAAVTVGAADDTAESSSSTNGTHNPQADLAASDMEGSVAKFAAAGVEDAEAFGEKRKRPTEEQPGDENSQKKVKHDGMSSTASPAPPERNLMIAKPTRNQSLEEVYVYLKPDHPVLQSIFNFYQLSPRFPRDRFMVRNMTGEPAKAIYYTSELVRDILTLNEGKGIKFVQAGVKMFMRQDAQGRDICRWRIQSEGTPIVDPWVGEDRIARIYKKVTLRKLLIEMFIKVGGQGWEDLGEVGPRLKDISMGCCLVRIEPSDSEGGLQERMVFPLWRSVSAINLMLPKEERKALLLRLFDDNTPLIDHNVLRMQEEKEQAAAAEEADDS